MKCYFLELTVAGSGDKILVNAELAPLFKRCAGQEGKPDGTLLLINGDPVPQRVLESLEVISAMIEGNGGIIVRSPKSERLVPRYHDVPAQERPAETVQ